MKCSDLMEIILNSSIRPLGETLMRRSLMHSKPHERDEKKWYNLKKLWLAPKDKKDQRENVLLLTVIV